MKPNRRTLLKSLGGAALAAALPGVSRADGVRVLTGPAFGSAWRLLLPDTGEAEAARRVVEETVARIDALMSPYRRESETERFGRHGEVRLSRETLEVVTTALDLARASDGAFDPTLAPLAARYGFGPRHMDARRPAGQFARLHLDEGRLRTREPGLTLDLCGLAKGYALERILGRLSGLDCLFELGGEIGTHGRHPSGRPWRLGIDRPGSPDIHRIIDAMDGRALATSGDAIQGYGLGGHRYGHVIDGRAERPVDNGVAQVSVLAPDAMLADGLATAAMVLGPEDGQALLANYDAAALFLLRGPGGDLVERDVNGFLEGQRS